MANLREIRHAVSTATPGGWSTVYDPHCMVGDPEA